MGIPELANANDGTGIGRDGNGRLRGVGDNERGAGRRAGLESLAALVAILALLAATTQAAPAARAASAPDAPITATSLPSSVREHGNILGNPRAPVTLTVFSDLQCPVCDPFFLEALPKLIPRWMQTGKVRVEYRALQTATRDRREFLQDTVAASAAGAQGKEYLFIDNFLRAQGEENSGYATPAFLERIASQTEGLDLATWKSARRNPRYLHEVSEDERVATRHQVNGTPAFLVGRTGRRLRLLEVSALSSPGEFSRAFEAALRR
jgi:protein-disulfide isomerase